MVSYGEKKRRGSGFFPWLLVVMAIWIAAPLLLVAGLTWVSWQQSVHGSAEPVWTEVEDAGAHADRRVELALTWLDQPGVLAPAWSGLVRGVSVVAGQTLSSGDPVARIDGITRLAWHGPAPFYRTLSLRDAGDDVASLNELLRHRGVAAGDGESFTTQTRQGVADLGRQLGIPDNRGVFDPALVVYLPGPEVLVTDVLLRVGEPAPGQGEPLVTTAPGLASVLLTASGVARAAGETTGANGEATVSTLVAADDETLLLGETALTLAESRDRLDAAGIAVVAEVASAGQSVVIAQLRRELPGGSVRVPSAAVHTAPDGAVCLVVGSPESPATVAVSVVGGLAGETVVTGGVSPGQSVGIGTLAPGAACS